MSDAVEVMIKKMLPKCMEVTYSGMTRNATLSVHEYMVFEFDPSTTLDTIKHQRELAERVQEAKADFSAKLKNIIAELDK